MDDRGVELLLAAPRDVNNRSFAYVHVFLFSRFNPSSDRFMLTELNHPLGKVLHQKRTMPRDVL